MRQRDDGAGARQGGWGTRLSMDATVELFAGIGGFRIAADRVGLRTAWANDACPRASAVYRDRFGEGELREGDLREFVEDVPPHDVLTAGFPCQPFSSAGKKQGIRDPRGTLFQVVVDVVRRHRPQWFVLENVKRLLTMERGSHFATILAALSELDYVVEWRLLNAVDFGLAQNRQRVFVIGTRGDVAGDGSGSRLAVPGDFARESSAAKPDVGPLPCPSGEWFPVERHGARFPAWGVARERRFQGRDPARFSLALPAATLRSVLQKRVAERFDFTESTVERLRESRLVERFVEGVEILSNQNGGARMGYTVFGVRGVAPTLTATPSRHYERYRVGRRYRRLTNVEYARLQGFPDDHCRSASIYEQYALYGNAVPPPMAEWVLRRLPAVPSAGLRE